MSEHESKTVLIVDDDKAIRTMAGEVLGIENYRVITAENGLVALERVLEEPDAVLLDIRMPVMDGFEFARRLWAMPEPFCSIPIIPSTADSGRSNQEVEKLGSPLYKPYTLDSLISRVSLAINSRMRAINLEK